MITLLLHLLRLLPRPSPPGPREPRLAPPTRRLESFYDGTRLPRGRLPDHRSGLEVDVTWEVKTYEAVDSVPGAPRAFRIVYTVRSQELSRQRSRPLPGRASWSLVTWYAPETQQTVKMSEPNMEALNLQAKTSIAPATTPAASPLPASPPAALPPGQALPSVTAAAPTTTP